MTRLLPFAALVIVQTFFLGWAALANEAKVHSSESIPLIQTATPTQPPEPQDLESQKLRQEIGKLTEEIQNLRRARGFWAGVAPSLAPLLTALVAIIGVFITINKQSRDRRDQLLQHEEAERQRQEAALRQQEEDREQREVETLRLFLENMGQVGQNLGAKDQVAQATAAASVATYATTFLQPNYLAFHGAVFGWLVGLLRIEFSRELRSTLTGVFEQAIRRRLASMSDEERASGVDLSRVHLSRVRMNDLDLRGADIAFADFTGADITGTDLTRAKGYAVCLNEARLSGGQLGEARLQRAQCKDTQFHSSRLVSADFKDANLSRAELFEARAQGADFRRATLEGARFEKANVSDADFRGASFDDAALMSLRRADHLSTAKIDDAIRERMEELSRR